jgi:hypothetical protein
MRWIAALIHHVAGRIPFNSCSTKAKRLSCGSILTDRDRSAGCTTMGRPAQDTMSRWTAEIGSATYVAVGATFEFIGGTKKQAPE